MGTHFAIFEDLGLIPYADAWDYQEFRLQENIKIKSENKDTDPLIMPTVNRMIFCEHPPVYTLGKSGKEEHALLNENELAEKGIGFFRTNRGGDITYHGPGQIVGYPIFDLEKFGRDIGKYLRNLEEVMILTLADYGLKGERSPGETGVWLDPDVKTKARKICAMGVRCSRWITMHGFALNVNTDLNYFNHIVPCGIPDKQVTSLEKELGVKLNQDEVAAKLLNAFSTVFDLEFIPLMQENDGSLN